MKITINKNQAREDRSINIEMAEPFTVAIIDPAWPYTVAPGKKDGTYVSQGETPLSGFVQGGKCDAGYKRTISISGLASLPVGGLVGGYVFLWTTMPFLPAALLVMEEWGFEYITGMCWGKYNISRAIKNGGNGGYGGVGFWFLGNHELCLLGKKKGMPSIRTGESSLFLAEKTRHSIKPDNIHAIVERYIPGPYLELFCRRDRPQWTVLGDDNPSDGQDMRESIPKRFGIPLSIPSDRFKQEVSRLRLTKQQIG